MDESTSFEYSTGSLAPLGNAISLTNRLVGLDDFLWLDNSLEFTTESFHQFVYSADIQVGSLMTLVGCNPAVP